MPANTNYGSVGTVKEICERALRQARLFSINDTGADPLWLQEAAWWLERNVKQLSGRARILYHIPVTLVIPLTPGKSVYKLSTKDVSAIEAADMAQDLGVAPVDIDQLPDFRIQFPIFAALRSPAGLGDEHEISIISRLSYERISNKVQAGPPSSIMIDRTGRPLMYTWPVLGTGQTAEIRLLVQTYFPALADLAIERKIGLSDAWERWAIYATAFDLAMGAGRTLPKDVRDDIRRERDDAYYQMMAFENDDHWHVQRTQYLDLGVPEDVGPPIAQQDRDRWQKKW